MHDDWTIDRFLTFALGLSTLETLDPATIQELGEGLSFLASVQAQTAQRYEQVIQHQAATIQRQAATIEMQAATIERQQDALQVVRAGVVLLGEEDTP